MPMLEEPDDDEDEEMDANDGAKTRGGREVWAETRARAGDVR